MRGLAIVLAFVTAIVPAAGHEAARAERSEPPLIRITAVVTDQRGELIRGLRPADFEVTVDGKPQPLESAALWQPTPDRRRVFGLLLDEFHVSREDSAAVRQAMLSFLDGLRPGDLAIVIKPLDPLTAIAPTAEREPVRRAIESFEGRKGDYTPRTVFEEKYMAQAPAAVATARAQIVTSALRAMGAALAEGEDARGAILLVSDGFGRIRAGRDLPANLQTAVRIANRADAPVYVFVPSTAAAAAPAGDEPHEPALTALRALAGQTGGELVTGTPAFPQGVARVFREMDAHYVLTYRAAHGRDGRFHAVKVAVKRAALVRARAGYVAPHPPAELTAASGSAPLRMLKRSMLIQSWSGVRPLAGGGARVVLTWEPAARRPGTAAAPGAASIQMTATTPGGNVLFDDRVWPVGIGAPAAPGPNRASFDAPVGRVLIDMKILDARGVVLDTDARDVEVPDLQKAPATILTPAVVRVQSAMEFRRASEDPDAAPVASRDFRRTERLLVRVPAFTREGAPAPLTATLLNRWRQVMRTVPPLTEPRIEGLSQFDLPLASLAPGEYTLRLTTGSVSEFLTFRVRG